jgi:cytochrome c peroxidase
VTRAGALLSVVLAAACGAPEFQVSRDRSVSALPLAVPEPADNPTTPEKIELGRLLFWDPILSGQRDVACATCHHPDLAYADGRALSIGVGGHGLGPERTAGATAHRTPRSSMSILNVAWNGLGAHDADVAEAAPMFWDNRERSLENQALLPIQNLDEMRGPNFSESEILPEVVRRLNAIPEYVTRFEAAFGAASISAEAIGKSIAAFERTLVNPSSFDRFMAGDDAALSHAAKRGLAAFIHDGCSRCHSGPMLSDFELHRLGAPDPPGVLDEGDGRFRTPSLRNIVHTAPYMHGGTLDSLQAVLDFYEKVDTSLDPDLPDDFSPRDAGLFMPFFEALSDGDFDRALPDAVPSGLPVGGR